jgi:hypothetical protein
MDLVVHSPDCGPDRPAACLRVPLWIAATAASGFGRCLHPLLLEYHHLEVWYCTELDPYDETSNSGQGLL